MTFSAPREPIPLLSPSATPRGPGGLASLLRQAEQYAEKLGETPARALLGRVRGTGPGVSFGALVDSVRRRHSVEMQSPFEGSENVAGGVLLPDAAGLQGRDDGFLFLRFHAATRDLPMHTNEHSARLIYVLEGRGFFHVSAEGVHEFTGCAIRHVPVRSRDVLLFGAGVMHTFSTELEDLQLLSYHAPSSRSTTSGSTQCRSA